MAKKSNRKHEDYIYRLLYVDNNHQMQKVDLLVSAQNKSEAEAKGQEQLVLMAYSDLRYITEDSIVMSKDVLKLSPRYFSSLVSGCWTLVECEKQIAVSRHESKRDEETIYKAADKRRDNNGKKRRWSAAAKAARKARQEKTGKVGFELVA